MSIIIPSKFGSYLLILVNSKLHFAIANLLLMSKILILLLLMELLLIYIFSMLYFWQVCPTFIMFLGNLSNSSQCLDHKIPLMPTCMMVTSQLYSSNVGLTYWLSCADLTSRNALAWILPPWFCLLISLMFMHLGILSENWNIACFRDDNILIGVHINTN